MYFIGYDIGSSFTKACLLNAETGKAIANASYPDTEQQIFAFNPGWAEQDPTIWWEGVKYTTQHLLTHNNISSDQINGIGISYQMHGLVLVDKQQNVLRSSIIWCDSRAVEIGREAFRNIGEEACLNHMLNSPGNFTASKLRWVQQNEPEIYEQIHKIMLPGDYIAMRLSGEIHTTATGLSEGIFWDFKEAAISNTLLKHYEIDNRLIPEQVPCIGLQSLLSENAATELGLISGIPITYRAGDQPNNAFSLNVLNPGEIAATAGTSGVIYAVTDTVQHDPQSRVNTFAHVNYSHEAPKLGILLCINGTGISYSWLRKQLGSVYDYPTMNNLAAKAPIGCEGLSFLPWGNGAERVLCNESPGAAFHGLQFNQHNSTHMIRAVQEGIVFSFYYGMQVMEEMGLQPDVIRAGNANMFLSPVFRNTLAGITGVPIELFDTDGAQGSARAAALGSGYYSSTSEAFTGLERFQTIEPSAEDREIYLRAYERWLNVGIS